MDPARGPIANRRAARDRVIGDFVSFRFWVARSELQAKGVKNWRNTPFA